MTDNPDADRRVKVAENKLQEMAEELADAVEAVELLAPWADAGWDAYREISTKGEEAKYKLADAKAKAVIASAESK